MAEENEVRINGSDSSSLNFANGGLTGARRTPSPNGVDDIGDDVMAIMRVNKRLMMVESELDLTKHRLITAQESLQVSRPCTSSPHPSESESEYYLPMSDPVL